MFGSKDTCYTDDFSIVGSTGSDADIFIRFKNRLGNATDECFTGGWIIDLGAGSDIIINGGNFINADSVDMGAGDDVIEMGLGTVSDQVSRYGGHLSDYDFQTISDTNLTKLDGGAGRDTISYRTSTNASGVALTLTTAGATNFENLIGTGDPETITGGAGSDYLAGSDGYPSTSSDVLNGGAGNDMLLGATSASGLTTGFEAFAFIENYWPYTNNYTTEGTFRNGDASYYTSTGNHTLNGGSGDDILFGAQGEDVLDGGTGQDNLIGGRGIDTFVIRAGDGSTTLSEADVIQDFKDDTDLIGLDGGLQFSDLTIEQGTGNYAHMILISITSTGSIWQ